MAGNADTDLTQLSEDQQLALQQYTSVTDQDLNAALPLLRKCQWNVQIAIARFFDGEPPPEPEPNIPPPQSTRRQETLAHGFNDLRQRARPGLEPAPRVVGQPENRISPRPPLLLSAVLTPLNIALGLFSKLYNIFAYLFPSLARALARLSSRPTSTLHRSAQQRPALSPHASAVRFQKEFVEAYGEHPLPLMECGYSRAYDMAKQEFKFLLVVPLSPEHPDTDKFVRDVLLAPAVVEYLTDSDNHVLLWAGSVADSETYQVASSLNVTAFPTAVLVANTGSTASPAMSIVARITRPSSAEDLTTALQTASSQYSGVLSQNRSTQNEYQAARNLRQEQESAYERSLAADREKVRARKAAEEEKKQQEVAEKTAQDRAEQHALDLAAWKRWRASTLAPEPPQVAKDVVRTSLRLLDGEKVIRRFAADAPIDEVYAFVECYDEVRQRAEEMNEKTPMSPSGFEHSYGFRLVSPMPREVYDLEKGGTVAQRFGRSANLIAERIEDEEE